MSVATSHGVHQRPGSKRWLGALAGAISGAAAAILPMTVFYPLGRLFDPSAGGTPRGSLTTELLVGFVGGVIISPVGAGIGALVGQRLRLKQLQPRHHAVVLMVSMLISVGTFIALNGGFIDDRGSTDSLQLAVALGVLGWLVGAVACSLVRRTFLYAAR
ncbi:MAG: hypothetical protein WCP59_08665 [Actinomycetota bacterium]